MRLLALLALSLLSVFVVGKKRCVSVIGVLHCEANATLHQGVQVDLLDKDGVGFLKHLDGHDHNSFGFTNEKGQFSLDGCASDVDWFWIKNEPDIFVRVTHKCHGKLERRSLPVFYTFMPNTHDYGTILL